MPRYKKPTTSLEVSYDQTSCCPARGDQQWLLIEVKGGERAVQHSARAALLDLLAYRRAYEPSLSNSHQYGVGIAFGAELSPSRHTEVAITTPDNLKEALAPFLD
jgi:hypothetical protein